jgi:hypothetical protein
MNVTEPRPVPVRRWQVCSQLSFPSPANRLTGTLDQMALTPNGLRVGAGTRLRTTSMRHQPGARCAKSCGFGRLASDPRCGIA